MTEEQAEKIMLEYQELEHLIRLLENTANKRTIEAIALALAPSQKITYEVDKPHSSAPQGWIYNFQRLCDLLLQKEQIEAEEYAKYLARYYEIKKAITEAGLDSRERLYVELRYCKGLMLSDVSKRMKLRTTALRDIRKSALIKLAKELSDAM